MGFVAVMLAGCPSGLPDPAPDELRQPSGLLVSPDGARLFVTGGNWDLEQSSGTLMSIALDRLHGAIAGPIAPAHARTSASRPCRRVAESDATIECDPSVFIDASATVRLGSALGNIALDRPAGERGVMRLLVVQRSPAAIAWIDVGGPEQGFAVDCGQDDEGVCDERHLVTLRAGGVSTLPGNPSRVFVDREGFRFAYVPHLLSKALSLIDLAAGDGPEFTTVVAEFFNRSDPFGDADLSGGFAVTGRPCTAEASPRSARECTRPFLYASHRFWPGLRSFTVAPGLEVINVGPDVRLSPIGVEPITVSRPLMGDLAFADDAGETLLMIQTTPGAMAKVDTSLGVDGEPRNVLVGTVPLCDNPNLLAVHRPPAGEALALATCVSEGLLAVVGLSRFALIDLVRVGEGANEIAIDGPRQLAYVANTREDTISIVDLDPTHASFLQETARLGLDAGARE